MLIPLLFFSFFLNTFYTNNASAFGRQKAPITVAFDLGGVLFTTATLKAMSHLNPLYLTAYTIIYRKNPKLLKKRLYEILDNIQKEGNYCNARDEDGLLLPGLMADYMTGAKTNKTILTLIHSAIKMHPEWFISRIEQRLIEQTANLVFSAKNLVETRTILKAGLKFLRQCKKEGHRTIVVSNWDKESIQLLRKTFPQVFALFDDAIFSGAIGIMKPDTKIFQLLKEKCPGPCIFLDDQKENIKAARECNIYGILVPHKTSFFGIGKKPNFKHVINEFKLCKSRINHLYRNIEIIKDSIDQETESFA